MHFISCVRKNSYILHTSEQISPYLMLKIKTISKRLILIFEIKILPELMKYWWMMDNCFELVFNVKGSTKFTHIIYVYI